MHLAWANQASDICATAAALSEFVPVDRKAVEGHPFHFMLNFFDKDELGQLMAAREKVSSD